MLVVKEAYDQLARETAEDFIPARLLRRRIGRILGIRPVDVETLDQMLLVAQTQRGCCVSSCGLGVRIIQIHKKENA